jgi:hypothetical protein
MRYEVLTAMNVLRCDTVKFSRQDPTILRNFLLPQMAAAGFSKMRVPIRPQRVTFLKLIILTLAMLTQ